MSVEDLFCYQTKVSFLALTFLSVTSVNRMRLLLLFIVFWTKLRHIFAFHFTYLLAVTLMLQ